jgi:hypothetical protein
MNEIEEGDQVRLVYLDTNRKPIIGTVVKIFDNKEQLGELWDIIEENIGILTFPIAAVVITDNSELTLYPELSDCVLYKKIHLQYLM